MQGKRNRNPKQIFIFVVLMAVIFGTYFYMTSQKSQDTIKSLNTEAKKILAKDLSAEYPATPTSVVKFYSRISKCLYNDKWDNDEVNELIAMIRGLYSKELLANNPEKKYETNFKADIADYQDKKKTIRSYIVDGNSQITTWEENGIEFASLNAVYSVDELKDHYKIYQSFVLKKENNQWKLVGWKTIPEIEIIEK